MNADADREPVRPRDLALLLLASGDLLPRQRARDQQADRTGLDLKRRVLDQVAACDPEVEELEATLSAIVADVGQPTGPTRAIALGFLEDWQAARAAPAWIQHLLGEALRESSEDERHGRRVP